MYLSTTTADKYPQNDFDYLQTPLHLMSIKAWQKVQQFVIFWVQLPH